VKTTARNQHYLLSSLTMKQKIRLFFIFKPYRKKLFLLRVKITRIFKHPDPTKLAGIAPGLSKLTDLEGLRRTWDQ
jgi:hypothetical protein